MFDLLYKHITSKVEITPAEWEICKTVFIPKKLRRKQYLLQEGNTCEEIAFVNKGALRSYTVDENGEEHIAQFALENWWISDLNSFLTCEPSVYNIDALEDSEILILKREGRNKLLDQIPKIERYFRILIEGGYVALHQRLISTISDTAEQKYLRMQQLYPDIMNRVPQHMIASYLGLKPETLSRVRKKLAEEK